MKPASTRVLDIPELVDLVASHLSKIDISNLMQTSRHMQQLVTPAFYRDIKTYHSSAETGGTNLWESPEGLRALARNIRHVRTWRSWVFFFIYYFHATAAHDDNNNGNSNDNGMSISSLDVSRHQQQDVSFIPQPTDTWEAQPTDNLYAQPSNIPSSSTPHLFSSATRDAFGLVPLLAMTQLVRLELSLTCSATCMLTDSRSGTFGALKMITSTLLDMVNLERLAINLCRRGSYHGIAKALFFGCPSSIKRLCLERVNPSLREGFDSSDIGSRIENGGVEALPRRTTHLVNVRDLSLEDWKDSATKEELLSIFQQCSGLETIRMVYPTVPVGFDAGDIGRICPRLHNIKLTGEALSPYKIMETLPENRLRTLDYYSLTRPLLDAATARRTFPRHACSLQMVKIHSPAQSSALRVILASCEGLEYVNFHSTCIDLSDAVASPWASTKMRYLSMDVNIIPSQSSPPGTDYIPYYLKTPPSPPTAEDKHIFSQLEALYRQIGELKNLVFLYIGRTHKSSSSSSSSSSFPTTTLAPRLDSSSVTPLTITFCPLIRPPPFQESASINAKNTDTRRNQRQQTTAAPGHTSLRRPLSLVTVNLCHLTFPATFDTCNHLPRVSTYLLLPFKNLQLPTKSSQFHVGMKYKKSRAPCPKLSAA
ncbi:hypothetical protein BKA57DRAFT_510531 [Linnemannia elongata]|nr:hypothetical protein BKA57DRAFT_510531 [Linnemannia elongata]